MENAELYKLAEYVLIWRGIIQALDSIRSVCVFTDNSIFIDGFFPIDLTQSTSEHPFESIYIGINKPPTRQGSPVPFGLPEDQESILTSVYFQQGTNVFKRTGMWEHRLLNIYNAIQAEQKMFTSGDKGSVADGQLFPDDW